MDQSVSLALAPVQISSAKETLQMSSMNSGAMGQAPLGDPLAEPKKQRAWKVTNRDCPKTKDKDWLRAGTKGLAAQGSVREVPIPENSPVLVGSPNGDAESPSKGAEVQAKRKFRRELAGKDKGNQQQSQASKRGL